MSREPRLSLVYCTRLSVGPKFVFFFQSIIQMQDQNCSCSCGKTVLVNAFLKQHEQKETCFLKIFKFLFSYHALKIFKNLNCGFYPRFTNVSCGNMIYVFWLSLKKIILSCFNHTPRKSLIYEIF